jgi:DEAD/DEAH box helicase domain-containing protein
LSTRSPDIDEYIAALIASPRMGDQVVHHRLIPGEPPRYGDDDIPWPAAIREMLNRLSIHRLYSHQTEAIRAVRSGRHTVAATPTASGKTLIYNLPFFDKRLDRPTAKALYLFPLKALAQDQLAGFRRMAAACEGLSAPAEIYDGDTTPYRRKKIRDHPPAALMTNPEMLHLSLLPYHPKWQGFFRDLTLVVVDEVHTYRGVMGSHMAQVFRRLRRICRYYGADPTFVFSSATVGNPDELARELTGLDVHPVTRSGAPRGPRHLVFLDPLQGPARSAILLLKAALHRGLRTIVYTQSRKLTELIAIWAGNQARARGRFGDKISAYRAGLLPEERREIERRLSSGDLLAVISTSALELGIDIGDLDLCLLVGYPGTIVATWQRAGRVGRSGQSSALVLIGGEDALDQYFLRHPRELLDRPPETAVVNPDNPAILKKHLVCAAAELSLAADDPILGDEAARKAAADLEAGGDLLRSADGGTLFSRAKSPHRRVNLRGAGGQYAIVCAETGRHKGEIDEYRAFRETHPGAVYLHMGRTHIVRSLDPDTRTVTVTETDVDYYTRVRGNKDTTILEICEETPVRATRVCRGRLKVTDQVTGYEQWRIHGRKKLKIIPLDLPPQTYETEGIWFIVPPSVQKATEAARHHFMGGIHAVEHAAISIFPLLVMSDRNDLGGISTPLHPQLGTAAVFVYDGMPGGAGISHGAFYRAEELLSAAFKAIAECDCETGCPSCVHSPKCGSGNRPIDKAAALFVLNGLLEKAAPVRPIPTPPSPRSAPGLQPPSAVRPTARYGVLDIETQRSADEVGGWHLADRMGISCVVLYIAETDAYEEYLEKDVAALMDRLWKLDLVVGFNIRRFDYKVLSGYVDYDFRRLPTLDILEEVQGRLGYRLSLDHLAGETLGARKSADGLQALRWWKEGRVREIIDYCKQDVAITRDLFLFGREKGYLLFRNKAGQAVRAPVSW